MRFGKKMSVCTLAAAMVLSAFAGCSNSGNNAGSSSSAAASAAPAASSAAGTSGDASYKGAQLVVATWGFSAANLKKISKDFESQYGCTVVTDETSGNSERLNKLTAQKNNPKIDVALLTDSFADQGNRKGLFDKIDTSVVTNLSNLYTFAGNKDGYGPAYSVVRYGIMYNADKVKTAPTSYQDLFSDAYKGKVALPDMTSTAGPYLLMTLAKDLSGDEKNADAAFKFLESKKGNVNLWYTTSADVTKAFSTGDIDAALFMDMNMPALTKSGLNIKWVDPKEGDFSAAATVNVVKNGKNEKLAQLFVNYLLSDKVQSQIAGTMNEAPTSKNATMPDAQKKYLVFGQSQADALKTFDWSYVNSNKADWVETFQKNVAVSK
jgi:putative spermidine/putrescine transport system substrate-binding protein